MKITTIGLDIAKSVFHLFAVNKLGRFVKKKGFDVLIDAVAELKKRRVAVKLLIGGGGEEKRALREQMVALGLEKDIT